MAAVTAQQQTSARGARAANLISWLFIILGLTAITLLFTSVANNSEISAASEGEGSIILAFLDNYGIVIPLMALGFGIYCIQLAMQINGRSYVAASWAQLVLLWLTIFTLGFVFFSLPSAITGNAEAGAWAIIIIATIGGGIFAYTWNWINLNKVDSFEGTDTLMSRDTRLAWNLLVPTVAVLLIVAARPLERTFIASLTNQEFAGTAEVEFVGFDNYAQLLGVRIDRIPCEQAEGGGCLEEENRQGEMETVFPSPRDYLGERYTELRYRTVNEWQIGDSTYLFSARDRDFLNSIQTTLFFAAISVIAELILGMAIALVVNTKFVGRGAMRAAMLVPWAIPTVVSAKLWEVMLRDNQSGVINSILSNFGISSQAWLANPDLQVWSLIFVDVWKTTPFMALLILAGLQTIPADIYEAADVDGAGKIRQFFSITLPMLRPTIAVALVFRTLDSIRAFDLFDVLVGRQLQSMATYNQFVLVENQEFGYASAIGVTIFVLIFIFTIIYVRALGVDPE